MNYYKLYFAQNLEGGLIYCSNDKLSPLVRVLVKLRKKLTTAIVGEEVQKPEDFKCEEIVEVLDDEPIINEELFSLAEWVSHYYHYPLGMALFAVLDRGARVEVNQKVVKLQEESGDELLKLLPESGDIRVEDLQKKYGKSGFFKKLEELENEGFLRILRTNSTESLKGKENFIKLNCVEIGDTKLGVKQRELFDFLVECEKAVPLSVISKKFSYAVVKGLEEKGIVGRELRDRYSQILESQEESAPRVDLTDEQTEAYLQIKSDIEKEVFSSFLLFGKTGTGKTEVYFKAMEDCLRLGKTVLFLLPEISLTPMMLQRVGRAFPKEKIAILHSGLAGVERYLQWKRAKTAQIVLGVRSAIFAPLQNVGLIVVDEEHEQTFKQDNAPFYNARDLALVRAKKNNAVVILGSATPSFASWHNAMAGKHILLRLNNRPFKASFPSVEILDLKEEKSLLTERFKQLVRDRLSKKEQVIILQNRRGHSSYLQCRDCGELLQCPHCQISLSYHSSDNLLRCHYCGFVREVPKKCPVCGNYGFMKGGTGTQKIEELLNKNFPKAKILRIDSDTASSFAKHKVNLEKIEKGEVDIILGTQIVAKGWDFPNITLAVVLRADDLLNMPDFMAGERNFALLTQVAGRTGRGEKKGTFLLQSYNPENLCLQMVKSGELEQFVEESLEHREILDYPPYSKLVRFVFSSLDRAKLEKFLQENKKLFDHMESKIKVLGPTPAPVFRLKKRFRYHVVVKAKNSKEANWVVKFMKLNLTHLYSVRLTIDVDPYSLF